MTYRLMVVAAASETLRNLPEQLGDSVAVQLFSSADEALWEMRTNPPEALIAEVELPGMSGLELAEIVPNFEVPTRVLLYSPTDDSARAQAEAFGVYQFLHGQLSPDELSATLHAAMESAAAAAADLEAEAVEARAEEAQPAPPEAPQERRRSGAAPVEAAPERPADKSAERRGDFTPARVTLPTMREREAAATAAPTPAPARGGLAARSKAAASRVEPASRPAPVAPQRPAAPQQAPAADPSPGSWRSSANSLVVTEQNVSAIRGVMGQLAQDLGTQSVMLTDRAGMVLLEVGGAANLPMMIVLPLLSTGFSTTGEVARQLHEEDATSVYIHEGQGVDLYCFDVMQRFLLVLVFNKKVASSKIGAVWINAKRAIRELREAF
jgi:DNA-binding NarL/FixJ family response regulator